MMTESNGHEAFYTFITKVGTPFHIMNDNAKM